MSTRPERKVYISWINHHGRSQSIADRLKITAVFVNPTRKLVPIRYLCSTFVTFRVLRNSKANTVFLMLPPFPALIAVRIYSFFRPLLIIADLHTGVFLNPKWKWALPLTLKMIGRRNLALVTNSTLKKMCTDSDIEAVVLHDIMPEESTVRDQKERLKFVVAVPLSYANDEPIDEILAAAEATPDLEWHLTGTAPAAVLRKASKNVRFTGYLTNADYLSLVSSASVVLALTTREHTMQRAAYEALANRTPLVTSKFPELQEYFEDSAIYVEANATEIAAGVSKAIDRSRLLQTRMQKVQQSRKSDEQRSIDELTCKVMNRLERW